ncbi:MAG: hypothetical protein LBR60_02340 [Fibrobacter sp.]|nr:hypothetical protein [Fibrobacter sp.]
MKSAIIRCIDSVRACMKVRDKGHVTRIPFSCFFLLTFFGFLFSGCVAHWIVEGEVRLQIENRSSFEIARLRVVGDSVASDWISDTIPPGKKSEVVNGPWSGIFDLEISVRDSVLAGGDTLWRRVRFPSETLDGGSRVAKIAQKDGTWTIRIK